MSQIQRKRLGEILIEQGALDAERLEKALAHQKEHGGLIGQILIQLGFVKEEDIVIALATQFNFPYLPIANFELNRKAAASVPVAFAREFLVVPIDRIHNVLTVVMADPANETVLKDLETQSGCKVQAFVSTVTEIQQALVKIYGAAIQPTDASDNVSKHSFESKKAA